MKRAEAGGRQGQPPRIQRHSATEKRGGAHGIPASIPPVLPRDDRGSQRTIGAGRLIDHRRCPLAGLLGQRWQTGRRQAWKEARRGGRIGTAAIRTSGLESFAAGKGRPTSRWQREAKATASAESERGASAETSRGSTGLKGTPRQAGPSHWGRRGASSGRGATVPSASRSARRACGASADRWPASQSPQLASAPLLPRNTTANAPKTLMAATMRGLAANRDARLGRSRCMGQKPGIRLGRPTPSPPPPNSIFPVFQEL